MRKTMKRKYDDGDIRNFFKKKKIDVIKIDLHEILYQIFQYNLTYDDYRNISLVSKKFNTIINNVILNDIDKNNMYFPVQNIQKNDNYVYTPIKYMIYLRDKDIFYSDKQGTRLYMFYKGSQVDELYDYYAKTNVFNFKNKEYTVESSEMQYHDYLMESSCKLENEKTIDSSALKSITNFIINNKLLFIFNLIKNYKAIIAGSFVLYYLLGEPKTWKPGDIDIWVSNRYVEEIQIILLKQKIDYTRVEGHSSSEEYEEPLINIDLNGVKIQIIFGGRQIKSCIDENFDINICKCIYDIKTTTILFDESFLLKKEFEINEYIKIKCDNILSEKITNYDNLSILKSIMNRIKKYVSRGFKLINYDLNEIDKIIELIK